MSVHTQAASSAIAYHEGLAAGWDARYRAGGFRRRARFFETAILPRLATEGRRWIDVGCGSGYFARMLAGRGAEVLGLDGSAAMIEAAWAATTTDATPVAFEVVDTVERLPLADASADGCLSLSVLEYLDDPWTCLAEMTRVVRPGGTVVTSTPDPRSVVRRVQGWRRARPDRGNSADYLKSSRRCWTPAELEAWAGSCGLVPRFSAGFDPILPRPLWALGAPSLRFAIWSKTGGRRS